MATFLELQSVLAGRVGERLHAPVVQVAAAIEDHPSHAGRLRPFGDEPAHQGSLLRTLRAGDRLVETRRVRQPDASLVVYQLGVDAQVRAIPRQAWPRVGAADLAPDAPITAHPGL